MYQVKKRSGELELFELAKVKSAIQRTFESCNRNYQPSIIETLSIKSIALAEKKVNDDILSVEDIQDSVETTLMNLGYEDVAKAYILYRKQHERVRNAKETLINYKKTVESYKDRDDWRVKENSTVTYSLGGLILNNSGAMIANYWLSEIYDDEIANAHRNCDIHLHDLSYLSAYCAGWSLKQLIQEGLGGVPGKISSEPASHLSTLCNQMVNFIGILQNEWAGAQAFSSVDTYLAPFVKVDNLSYKEVKQCIQSLVFGLNTPSRWGSQAPFSNFTMDWTVPEDLANLNCIVGGKELDFCYKDCKREMDMINKAFMEVMMEGDANGRGHQYPIPTYSITKDFDWDPEIPNNKLLFEMTAKYGIPYFSNYVNSDMSPSDLRAMCLHPDTKVRFKYDKTFVETSIQDMYDNYDVNKIQILTKFGLRPVKEVQRFGYTGKLLKFTFDNGTTLITTPDHDHVIYEFTGVRRYTNGEKGGFFEYGKQPKGWYLKSKSPVIDGKCHLIKRKASDLKVGDYLSVRSKNGGEYRRGKTYEESYGEDKAKQLKQMFSEDRKGRVSWNKGIPTPLEVRKKISEAGIGHYVSEKCRKASSERWKGSKNPYNKNGVRVSGRSASISSYEIDFEKELLALDTEFVKQYPVLNNNKNYICDFYIPEKNLIIELETDYRYSECSYNNTEKVFIPHLKNKYNDIISSGYNLLVINPKIDKSSYRCYINNHTQIINIESIDYDGYVYDLEVNCDDVSGDTTLYHTFYANDILTGNCCRLRLDLRELRRKSGGYFGSGESTGSIGVVTINLPRIAYTSETEEEFFNKLSKQMDIAARSLHIKRSVVSQLLEQGLYPYTKRYLGSFNNHFSTIGLVGMNECCLNASWIRSDISTNSGYEFSKKVLDYMREKLSDYQEQYGNLYNLEATPAESTAYRFAKHDKEKYPDIITAGDNTDGAPYYTNSSHLPVGYTDDIFEALDHQDELQIKYTSGTVFHAFLGEKLPNWQSAMNLTRKIAENYKLPYFTFSPTYSICPDHGYLTGEQWTCPHCGKPTEVYSRVTGYYRAVQNFNDGKAHEFKDRKEYSVLDRKSFNTAVEVKEEPELRETPTITKPLLVTTSTCPNCKIVKKLLDDYGFDYDIIVADNDMETARAFDINQAPTLVVNSDSGIVKIANVSNIKKFLDELETEE